MKFCFKLLIYAISICLIFSVTNSLGLRREKKIQSKYEVYKNFNSTIVIPQRQNTNDKNNTNQTKIEPAFTPKEIPKPVLEHLPEKVDEPIHHHNLNQEDDHKIHNHTQEDIYKINHTKYNNSTKDIEVPNVYKHDDVHVKEGEVHIDSTIIIGNKPSEIYNSSLTNKSTAYKTTIGQTSMNSYDAYNSRLKKRKLIILGKMGCGKTSILKRFVDNSLPDKPSLTIEETLTKNYFYKNEEIKLVMLDTAGQSEYTPALPNRYCIGVHGFILTFSIEDNHSFEVIQHVNKILLEGIGTKYIPRILVGNKKDLDSQREVSEERIKKLAKTLKCPYIECSALQGGAEIEKIFYKLLKEVDKETNDEYPYDIKNSTIRMNYIRKHHKNFNQALIFLLILLVSCGVFLLIYTCVIACQSMQFINPYIIINLIFSLLLCLNSFRGIRVIRKQIYQNMNSVTITMCISSLANFLLFVLVFFKAAVSEEIWKSFETFNPMSLYILLMFIQVWSVIIIKNLEPLYKEFYSSSAINQQLLIKI